MELIIEPEGLVPAGCLGFFRQFPPLGTSRSNQVDSSPAPRVLERGSDAELSRNPPRAVGFQVVGRGGLPGRCSRGARLQTAVLTLKLFSREHSHEPEEPASERRPDFWLHREPVVRHRTSRPEFGHIPAGYPGGKERILHSGSARFHHQHPDRPGHASGPTPRRFRIRSLNEFVPAHSECCRTAANATASTPRDSTSIVPCLTVSV